MNSPDFAIPELEIAHCDLDRIGESNTIYRIIGNYRGVSLIAYLKISKEASSRLAKEHEILLALSSSNVPVPRVLWASEKRDALLLEDSGGVMIWDIIDPRRDCFDQNKVLITLYRYGEMLGRIHRLSLQSPYQPRVRLYDLIGEEEIKDPRFSDIIHWLRANEVTYRDNVFVHGD